MAKMPPSAAPYTKFRLFFYDLFVVDLNCKYFWKCHKQVILDFFNQHITSQHLDVGVGTGYYLDKCYFPNPQPIIHLLDLNPNALAKAAARIKRYHPITHCADILAPITCINTHFDSISINFLLHCLPGTMLDKEAVFKHLIPLLNSGGILFGTTVLAKNANTHFLAQKLMDIYNEKQIYDNTQDKLEDLEKILANNFKTYAVQQVGCVALFWGRI